MAVFPHEKMITSACAIPVGPILSDIINYVINNGTWVTRDFIACMHTYITTNCIWVTTFPRPAKG